MLDFDESSKATSGGRFLRVVVTGASGFLGGHIARTFISEGWEVTGFDLTESRIPRMTNVVGDLLDVETLKSCFEGQEVICHVGAIGDVYLAGEQPGLAAMVNVAGSSNVADAARVSGSRVVYASTWEVYGDPVYEPVDEKHPCEPEHPYNITKLAGERMLLAADDLHGVPTVALRLGTAYGLGMRPNSVFEIFIQRARSGKPLTIQGDGSQGRQFTHASDIARAFVLAASSDVHGKAINIVSPETVSIKQLAEAVISRYPAEVTFGNPRPGDVAPSQVTSALAKEMLGWAPQVEFEKGMEELLDPSRG